MGKRIKSGGVENQILIILEFDGNAPFPISVTDEGIVICVNDEHLQNA